MFPIDLTEYKPLKFELSQAEMTKEQSEQLSKNISIARDSIIFITALASARGLGGHTGGAFDLVPEALIVDGFMRGSDALYPVFFDEAGHRVALQYLLAALDERVTGMTPEDLLHYREHGKGLYGHPERDEERGVMFSSGRLGHMFGYCNGVAEANPDKTVIMFGSDGSQQEGNDAEAARYAVAFGLKVVTLLDDNNITIEGHTNDNMPGYDLERTLSGHGMAVDSGDGEDYAKLYKRIQKALNANGPVALVNKRLMAPGVNEIEDTSKGHDAISPGCALPYLRERGHKAAMKMLIEAEPIKTEKTYLGSSKEHGKNRSEFGNVICSILSELTDDAVKNILAISADLGGSTGMEVIGKKFPAIYRKGGVMERNGVSAVAGFGSVPGKQGIFATFAAFSEMVISEITMARLNDANAIFHFSHSGVDDMADNTCHYGVNNFFTDSGLETGDNTRLYFPADPLQLESMLRKVFFEPGLRFVFSTRSSVPFILDENGNKFFDSKNGYMFYAGKDDLIREGEDGYIVAYGEMLYRALDAVERLKKENIHVGLINKATLNIPDEAMIEKIGTAPFILVAESQNRKTGLGSRFGTWLIERDHGPLYAHIGTYRPGIGGVSEQLGYQGLEADDIIAKVKSLI